MTKCRSNSRTGATTKHFNNTQTGGQIVLKDWHKHNRTTIELPSPSFPPSERNYLILMLKNLVGKRKDITDTAKSLTSDQ
jgi:hypothetical protein